jgi:hypothetical protein
MKSFGIIHILLFLILMVAYQCAGAQDYVITTKGDSLAGTVKVLSFGPDKKVQVSDANKKKTVVPLFQVKEYAWRNELYQPVKGPSGYTFMKVLKKGYASLFAFQLENQTTFDGRYLMRKDGTGAEVPNLSFKKSMTKFFSDCQEVADKIEAGAYGRKDIEKILDDYNACIEGKVTVHNQAVAVKTEQVKKINVWDALENKVKTQPDSDNKTTALEMIGEIKNKISKGEKVPNFVISGLKSSITQPELQPELEAALKEIQ